MARHARTIGAEYRLAFTPFTDPHSHSPAMRVSLETAQAFAAFRYGLSVSETHQGTHVQYTVRGLSAPDLRLPGAGPAGFVREYSNLWGTCTFEVLGLDGTASSCTVRLTPGRAEVISPPETGHLVVEIVDDENLSQERP